MQKWVLARNNIMHVKPQHHNLPRVFLNYPIRM